MKIQPPPNNAPIFAWTMFTLHAILGIVRQILGDALPVLKTNTQRLASAIWTAALELWYGLALVFILLGAAFILITAPVSLPLLGWHVRWQWRKINPERG